MQLLVVEPDHSQQALLGAMASQMGHEATFVRTGEEALGVIEDEPASTLLCNMDLPEMSGLDLMHLLRQRSYDRYLYAILFTGRDPDVAYLDALTAGADDFMATPIRRRTLDVRLQVAERVLRYDDRLRATRLRLEKANSEITQGLQEASRAQARLLPAPGRIPGDFKVDLLFRPANFVSGDMLGTIAINNACMGFYAVDVAGHGMRSALRAVTLSHTITNQLFLDTVGSARPWAPGRRFVPDRLAALLNERFVEELDTDDYFSLMCGIVDLEAGEAIVCQAGHPRAMIMRQGGAIEWIGQGGYPVGLLSDAQFVSERTVFRPGDHLVIFSDGISEAESPTGEPFGEANLARTCAAAVKDGAPLSSAVEHALETWVAAERFQDDVSLLIVSAGGKHA
ncbi:fused response regulator/phosphatase [Pelagibacterium limicola]|uniref:fused response regulator/phosphatase n=1 Tax=Pelagibacterium limicola TaxID=2791022 RepID=UPI0018B00CF3|nr:fused response regulator/phosphatase [Pelagibacterium limicola]